MNVGHDEDGPVAQWRTTVTYPPDHATAAGWTLDIPAGPNETLARRRAGIHRSQGAEAVVMSRTWTPSEWAAVEDES